MLPAYYFIYHYTATAIDLYLPPVYVGCCDGEAAVIL